MPEYPPQLASDTGLSSKPARDGKWHELRADGSAELVATPADCWRHRPLTAYLKAAGGVDRQSGLDTDSIAITGYSPLESFGQANSPSDFPSGWRTKFFFRRT